MAGGTLVFVGLLDGQVIAVSERARPVVWGQQTGVAQLRWDHGQP